MIESIFPIALLVSDSTSPNAATESLIAGTGFAIEKEIIDGKPFGKIITARHVLETNSPKLERGDDFWRPFEAGKKIAYALIPSVDNEIRERRIKHIGFNSSGTTSPEGLGHNDVCVCRIELFPGDLFVTLPIYFGTLPTGTPVKSFGYRKPEEKLGKKILEPSMVNSKIVDCICPANRKSHNNAWEYLLSEKIPHGFSGGPVTYNGAVIAMTSSQAAELILHVVFQNETTGHFKILEGKITETWFLDFLITQEPKPYDVEISNTDTQEEILEKFSNLTGEKLKCAGDLEKELTKVGKENSIVIKVPHKAESHTEIMGAITKAIIAAWKFTERATITLTSSEDSLPSRK